MAAAAVSVMRWPSTGASRARCSDLLKHFCPRMEQCECPVALIGALCDCQPADLVQRLVWC